MPRNSLFPNSITIHYTSNGHQHNMDLPVGVVGGSAPNWTLPVRSGAPVVWMDAIDTWAALISGLFHTTDSIDYADLFTYEAPTSSPEFLATHLIGQAGINATADAPWVQLVAPFKAPGNTSMRLTLLEGVEPPNAKLSYADVPASTLKDILDFVLSDDDWIITRAGTFPLASLGITTKVNDKLRKKFLLDV